MSVASPLRFATFELDASKGELRQRGDLVKLAPQPLKVLELLARRAGEVVTRQEIRDHVWRGETFVDFEQGLNFCVRQVREALGDTADAPRFIETLPRRGYRFLMPVQMAAPEPPAPMTTRLIVLPFTLLRADADSGFLAFSLPDALTAALAGLDALTVRSSSTATRFVGAEADPKHVGREADVDVVVSGTLLCAGGDVRVTTQLTDTANGTLLWSHTTQVPLGDVFSVQDELTQRIVESLSLPLTSREQRLLKRDVPAKPAAYEYFLRGNQLSYDSRQWGVARDLYLRSVEEDPKFAPAWARLGRMHHVMGKYLETGTAESLEQADAALRRALEINPDLPMAHKLLAHLDVDLGRVHDAMTRLIGRGPIADPEVLAGLVTACRCCGLLDASAAAHVRALALDPKIKTSVPHTWFMQRDFERVAAIGVSGFAYIVPMAMAQVGRRDEAIPLMRQIESKVPPRLRDFVVAGRTLLEGQPRESVAAISRVAASDFRDPEGLFYLARQLAHLQEHDASLALLDRIIGGGFFCLPVLERDPWLDPLRPSPAFSTLLRRAEGLHRAATDAFAHLRGAQVLGLTGLAAHA